MKKRKWGRIINICSAHSLRASPFKAPTCRPSMGSPASPRRWRWSLPSTASPANAVSPGFVWTPLVEKQIPDLAKSENITLEQAKKQVLSRQPTNQFVTVEQVAALAAFLAERVGGLDHRRQLLDRRRLDRAVAARVPHVSTDSMLLGCRSRAVSRWRHGRGILPRSNAAVMNAAAATVSSSGKHDLPRPAPQPPLRAPCSPALGHRSPLPNKERQQRTLSRAPKAARQIAHTSLNRESNACRVTLRRPYNPRMTQPSTSTR